MTFLAEDNSRLFLGLAALIVLGRVALLMMSPAALGPDESQYWYWSRDLDVGYFSKPPLIAWAIAATTALFGDGEWAVRLSAPLFHGGAAVLLYAAARRLFDEATAFWTGLAWLTLPAVSLSSFVITTDAPLLFFWSAGLFILTHIVLAEKAPVPAFAALGAAIGLGLLSKYAMLYFVIALAAATAFAPAVRRALWRAPLILTAAVAIALILPNIFWNAAHDFQTVSHTAANANWTENLFRLDGFATFFSAQLAVAGPVFFIAFFWLCWAAFRSGTALKNLQLQQWLLLFALTPLVIVCIQAFISRAHANWAAAAYPALVLLTVAWLFQRRMAWLAKAAIAVHAVLAVVFAIGLADFGVSDRAGLASATREIRGWREHSAQISAMAPGYDAVMIDDRALMGAMLYYERESDLEIVAIDPNASISTHYEAFKAFDPERQKRVLFVTTRDDAAHVDYRFRDITPVGQSVVDLGPDQSRRYSLFDVSGYFGKGAPQRED